MRDTSPPLIGADRVRVSRTSTGGPMVRSSARREGRRA